MESAPKGFRFRGSGVRIPSSAPVLSTFKRPATVPSVKIKTAEGCEEAWGPFDKFEEYHAITKMTVRIFFIRHFAGRDRCISEKAES